MEIITGKNRLRLVPSLIDIRAKHLTQGIGTEMGRGIACGSQMIDTSMENQWSFVLQGYSHSSFLHDIQSIYPLPIARHVVKAARK